MHRIDDFIAESSSSARLVSRRPLYRFYNLYL